MYVYIYIYKYIYVLYNSHYSVHSIKPRGKKFWFFFFTNIPRIMVARRWIHICFCFRHSGEFLKNPLLLLRIYERHSIYYYTQYILIHRQTIKYKFRVSVFFFRVRFLYTNIILVSVSTWEYSLLEYLFKTINRKFE